MTVEVWTGLALAIIGFEAWAIWDKRPRNTWSYWFWSKIRPYLVTRLIAYPVLLWTGWHWMLDMDGIDGDDVVAVVAGVLVALIATSRRSVGGTR